MNGDLSGNIDFFFVVVDSFSPFVVIVVVEIGPTVAAAAVAVVDDDDIAAVVAVVMPFALPDDVVDVSDAPTLLLADAPRGLDRSITINLPIRLRIFGLFCIVLF